MLSCPRVSPEWELAARLALVKPKPYTKEKIAHRDPQQPWPRNARRIVLGALGGSADVAFPRAGPHRMVARIIRDDPARARRLARKLSRQLPDLWFALGGDPHGSDDDDATNRRSYLRAGVFYRRSGKDKLELVRATHVRLRRSVRSGFLGDL